MSPPATLHGLAHVAIAVSDADAAARQYQTLLGARVTLRETLADRGILVVFLDVGGVRIELLQPMDAADEANTVARFLRKRGPGLHHVAFRVADAGAALRSAQASGAKLIDEKPRPGAEGCLVGFLHPDSTAGALIEFVEPPVERD